MKNLLALVFVCVFLAGCSKSSPGPLAGTWKMDGIMPMTIQFRTGETESLGMIEKVSYEVKGNDVIVTSLDGLMKGTSFRYTMVDPNTARTELGTLRKIK